MRNLLVPLIAVVFFLSACNSEPSFTVKVKVTGDNVDGKLVRVAMLDGAVPRDVDSTVVKGNSFKLKGRLKNPEFYLIYIGENGPMEVFLENSDITIECRLDSMSHARIKGSTSHDLFASFFTLMDPFGIKLEATRAQLSVGGAEFPVQKKDSIYKVIEQIQKEMNLSMLDFFKKNNNSVVSPFLLSHTILQDIPLEDLQAIVDNYGPGIQESPHTIEVKNQLDLRKRTMKGAIFSDFTMTDTLGISVSLANYVGKGKYVLMDVWASWCAPCRSANPSLVALYNKYKSKNFEIVGVSLDRDRAAWHQGIREDKLPWPQMSDLQFWQSEVVKLYNISGIPYTVFFDPQGKILYIGLTGEKLDATLKDLLIAPKK